MNNAENVIKVKIEDLIPNKYQPRKYFDEELLKELANSIKNHGILNPILVRKNNDKYEIIAGERRWRAAKMCGLTEIPAIIKETTEQQSAEIALIENLQRQDLTAIEAAKSYEEIIRLSGNTQNELATKIGKSQSSIANKLRLLTLPEEIQNAVINKKISERHARCLLNIKTKEKQIELLNKIIEEKLTVKETEELIEIENLNNDDINTAIDDIMKSLNINEKKEEKEAENMNNGNFFPNYDNNMNTMNNPTLGMPQGEENVMPTINNEPQQMVEQPMIPQPEMPLFNNNINMNTPTMDAPLFNIPAEAPPIANTNTFVAEQPMPSPINQTMESQPINNNFNMNSPVAETPLFNVSAEEPVLPNNNTFASEPINTPIQPEMPLFNNNINLPTGDTPLFNNATQEINIEPVGVTPIPPLFEQSAVNPANTYEIPVMESQPMPISTPVDKVTEVEQLLTNNGINYKKYSNDTGHCIIIEI